MSKPKFFFEGLRLKVTKCKRPSFKNHRGRTWDAVDIFFNDEKKDVHLDTTWGDFLYFKYGENYQWYKVRMQSTLEDDFKGKRYDIDPFHYPKPVIKVK